MSLEEDPNPATAAAAQAADCVASRVKAFRDMLLRDPFHDLEIGIAPLCF